jgi:FtsP/CotA-like multicopper oxidase with cupredoxin domain
MGVVSRRAVMSYGLGIGAAAVVGVMRKQDVSRARAARRSDPPQPPFPQPRVRTSAGGELSVRLTARRAVVDLGAPALVSTYCYGGSVPGATWELRGGDTLRVYLRNRLPDHPARPGRPGRPREWTTTSLHTHGLHVSPAGRADNAFAAVPPGAAEYLEIPVPRGHPGGIFWYHPQHPGAMTQQIRGGMAGALIVRGAIDEVAEVQAAREQVMVLQAIELGAGYRLADPDPDPAPGQAFFPRSAVLYPVNGALRPVLRMYPGEVQRWRLVNAAAATFMSLRLAGHHFHVLAWDGLTLAAPDPAGVLLLPPGGRAEVLVRAGRPGRYGLILTPGTSQRPDIPGMPAPGLPAAGRTGPVPGFPDGPGELAPRSLLTLEVTGHGPAMGLPSALPAWDPPALPVARRRTVAFSAIRRDGSAFPAYGVDGVPYAPRARPAGTPALDTAEEWTLVNAPGPGMSGCAHAIHLHTNPFLVTKRNGEPVSPPQWRDTTVLTQGANDTVTLTARFAAYPGRSALHCQVTPYADLGMLAPIDIRRGELRRPGT